MEAEEAVPWTKPDELVYSRNKPLPKLGKLLPGDFLAGMADGAVKMVNKTVSETTLRHAIEANDGQELGPDW